MTLQTILAEVRDSTHTLVFNRESIREVIPDAKGLIGLHFYEARESVNAEQGMISPRIYEMLEDAGVLFAFTVRRDGRLVGYANYMASITPRSQGKRYATQDTLYICKDARGGTTAREFIKFCDQCLSEAGIVEVGCGMPRRRGFARLLGPIGYRHKQNFWVRRLDDG